LTQRYVAKIRNRRIHPTLATVVAIAGALDAELIDQLRCSNATFRGGLIPSQNTLATA
jgi:predicted transcriptional regulator